MSFNSSHHTDLYRLSLAADLLNSEMGRWKSAITVADRMLAESDIVEKLEALLDEYVTEFVDRRDLPTLQNSKEFYTWTAHQLRSLTRYYSALRTSAVEQDNLFQSWKTHLGGKYFDLQSKLSAFKIWNGEYAFSHIEKFGRRSLFQDSKMSVFSAEKIATLPVIREKEITVSKIQISSSSNGFPGNSDESVTTNNINIENLISNNESLWFEYERLDSGPVNLHIKMVVDNSRYLNKIQIDPVSDLGSSGFEVVSITTDGLPVEAPYEISSVRASSANGVWTSRFLPVKTGSVSLHLRSSSSSDVEVAGVVRKRYSISAKNIKLLSVTYDKEGSLLSEDIPFPPAVYRMESSSNVFPANKLYNYEIVSGTDDALTPAEENILDGRGGTFRYQYKIKIDQEALVNAADFSGTVKTVYSPSLFGASASRQIPNVKMEIPNDSDPSSFYVYQPGLLPLGYEEDSKEVETGGRFVTGFRVPYNIVEHGFEPDDMNVFINGEKATRVEYYDTSVNVGEWAFDNTYQRILIRNTVATGDLTGVVAIKTTPDSISMVLSPEKMMLEQKSDGFYHYPKLPFDPDVETISMKQLPAEAIAKAMKLSEGRTVYNLGAEFIESITVLPSTYQSVATKADLDGASSTSYYLEPASGMLFFASAVSDDDVTVFFKHRSPADISNEDFSISWKNGSPEAIRISNGVLSMEEITETVGDAVRVKMNAISGRSEARASMFSSTSKKRQLSYDYVVKGSLSVSADFLSGASSAPNEIEFEDGVTEFYGLVTVDNEKTTAIAGSSNVAVFNLAAGFLWYSDVDPVFDDATVFSPSLKKTSASLVSSGGAGSWHVSDTGEVTVYVGTGTLKAGIGILYLYKDPNFDPTDKFSVDYANGIVYSSSNQDSAGVITYKVAEGTVSYQAVKPILRWSASSSTITVPSPRLLSNSPYVKVSYRKSVDAPLVEARQYFTPFVKDIVHRFA